MENDKIMTVAFLGFITVCFSLIGVSNLDIFKENSTSVIVPLAIAIVAGVLFVKRVKKL